MTSPKAEVPEVSPRTHLEHRLVLSQDSHGTVHGTGTMGRFNTWLAVKITKTVGTMWVAYIFAAIAGSYSSCRRRSNRGQRQSSSWPGSRRPSSSGGAADHHRRPERDPGGERRASRSRPRNVDRGAQVDRGGSRHQRGAERDPETAAGDGGVSGIPSRHGSGQIRTNGQCPARWLGRWRAPIGRYFVFGLEQEVDALDDRRGAQGVRDLAQRRVGNGPSPSCRRNRPHADARRSGQVRGVPAAPCQLAVESGRIHSSAHYFQIRNRVTSHADPPERVRFSGSCLPS